MKVIISTTYSDKYLFFLPIVTWAWNKLGVDVICFMPRDERAIFDERLTVILKYLPQRFQYKLQVFDAPAHKQATYAQCSRLYAAALFLPEEEEELLITSDVDMAVFQKPINYEGSMIIHGADLTPNGQYPMCYAHAKVKYWRGLFNIGQRTYQQCLDDLLGNIEAEHFKGNYWAKDQETLYNHVHGSALLIDRARPGTQFAAHRLDRDDAYLLERLSPDIIDYHMPRPGYEEKNFEQILTVLKYFYPTEDFGWLQNYIEQYNKILHE